MTLKTFRRFLTTFRRKGKCLSVFYKPRPYLLFIIQLYTPRPTLPLFNEARMALPSMKCGWSTSPVPGTVPGTGDVAGNKEGAVPPLTEFLA